MLTKTGPSTIDLSAELNDELDWKAGTLRTFAHHLDVTAWAYDPLSAIIAVGTGEGIINLYGGPGVECRLQLSEGARVRCLHFASSVFKLICIDSKDRLHVWDLTSPRTPKLQHIMNTKHPINSVSVSPSHTHAFIALANGEIYSYDLLCSRMSQYVVPNMWASYEERVFSGVSHAPGGASSLPIETVIHPRDLNLLFIGYTGGVILLDLTQRKTLKAYQFFVPPGAVGGIGYHDPDIMSERRPDLTAIAVHPSGHLLATGHADGSIALWAVEDEDKPLTAITLGGSQDVNVVNADELQAALSAKQMGHHDLREPIFRLAWSGLNNSNDPRGGETVLVALGGLYPSDMSGVTALRFPAFNPPEPPAQPVPGTSLDPKFRQSLRQTVLPLQSYCYTTAGIPQDFLLLPREHPHFSGCWDPTSILLLSDADKGARTTEAYQFPPASFVSKEEASKPSPTVSAPSDDADEALAQEIATTIQSMRIEEDTRAVNLPPSLWSGPSSIVSGSLINLDRDAYELFVSTSRSIEEPALCLRGGRAWAEDVEGEMKLLKFQPHRILVSDHTDLSVRFRDLSAQLLISSDTAPLHAHFPNPLPELTIDLLSVLADPSICSHTPPMLVEEASIASSHLASQSLECAIVLRSGEIAVFRQGVSAQGEPVGQKHLEDSELISTAHIHVPAGQKFLPSFIMVTGRGPVSACALADVGFFAAAFQDGSLYVVDMRGPRIMLRNLPEENIQKKHFLHRHEADPIVSLTWTVSGTDKNPQPRLMLLAVRSTGSTTVHSVRRSSEGNWTFSNNVEAAESSPSPLPCASFILESKTGNICRANSAGLALALSAPSEYSEKGRCFWVSAGLKGARCILDITGERIGRTSWPSGAGKVERVAIVQKNGATVLVAHTEKREALVYSLPFLEHMHSLQLTQSSQEPLSLDETGDYIEWCRHPCGVIEAEKYGTVFNVRRSAPYDPVQVDLTYGRRPLPPQPQPVSIGPPSMLTSLMGYIVSQSLTGDQIDLLLAGPDRPVPKPKPQRPTAPQTSSGSDTGGRQSPASWSSSVNNASASTSRAAGDLYTRLNNAMAERGEMLGSLEDSFNSLESGSKNMLAQAKSLAAKQTAKRWFNFS